MRPVHLVRLVRLVPRRLRRRVRRVAVVLVVGSALSALFGALVTGSALVVVARRWTRRVEVEGRSMSPALEPGDRLLVVRLPRRWPLRAGEVVAVPDPRDADRLLVKRVGDVVAGRVTLVGDNAAGSTDSRTFGAVARAKVWGRVCYRYSPAERSGRIVRRDVPWSSGMSPSETARHAGYHDAPLHLHGSTDPTTA